MVITEIKRMQPDLVYFDENYMGNYPDYSPVTLDELSILYPKASARAKSDENAMEEAKQATFDLQHGRRGYLALWKNILELSKRDLKKNYDNLNVSFDLWLGESDSRKYYEEVVEYTKNSGYAKLSQGAWIVDVSEQDDKKEVELASGVYKIQLEANKNYVLDVAGGSTANEANIQIYANNETDAQKWKNNAR